MTREDAKTFMRKVRIETMKGSYAEEAYEMAIKALEQSEIIRCKDCGHYDDNRCEMHEYLHFKENDFCSYAERKEE